MNSKDKHQATTKIYGLRATDAGIKKACEVHIIVFFSKSDIYSFFSRVYTHEFLHSSWPVLRLLMKILAIFRCTIHPLHCTETQQDSQTAEAVTEMNYSSQNNTVIFVDCEGLTPPSDAGLTDKAPPSSAACCRNRTPADGLETQQQTSPIDFLHFFGY